MPGKEALEWIKSVDKCSEPDAIEQLREAVLDRAVPIRFQGRSVPKLPEGHPLGLFFPETGPGASPILSVDWRVLLMPSAQFRADGMVKFTKTRWQPFEVRRDAVLRKWPSGPALSLPKRTKAKPVHDLICEIIDDLFPNGLGEIGAKERDDQIAKELLKRGKRAQSRESFVRAVQRAMKSRSKIVAATKNDKSDIN